MTTLHPLVVVLSAAPRWRSRPACAVKQPPAAGRRAAGVLPATTAVPPAGSRPAARRGVVATDWVQTFGDPQLEALVDEGLRNNLDLKAAAARVDVAAALVDAGALAAVSAARRQSAASALVGRDSTKDRSGIVGEISWELDLWGRVRAQAASADGGAAGDRRRPAVRAAVARGDRRDALVPDDRHRAAAARRRRMRPACTTSCCAWSGRATRSARSARRTSRSPAPTSIARGSASARSRPRSSRSCAASRSSSGRYPGGGAGAGPRPAAAAAAGPGRAAVGAARAASRSRRGGTARGGGVSPDPGGRGGAAAAHRADRRRRPLDERAAAARRRRRRVLDGRASICWRRSSPAARCRRRSRIATAEQQAALALYGQTALRAFSEVESSLASEQLLADQQRYLESVLAQDSEALRLGRLRYRRRRDAISCTCCSCRRGSSTRRST